ncbi:hypothetical protein RCDURKIN_130 [Rhodobacter phage RcDurkin]|nr:hypothetical protein RCDURKIN_130 [Rhodobacter phage RcDurkin]UUV43870.1 hypothetical protein RCKICKAPOO_129 [Rhodobacter phage RcKickapoo]
MKNRIVIEYVPDHKYGPQARLIEFEEDKQTGAMFVSDILEYSLFDTNGGSRASYIALHVFANRLQKGQSVEIRDGVMPEPIIKFEITRKRDILPAIMKVSLGLHMMVCDQRGYRELDGELIDGDGRGVRVFEGYCANPELSPQPYIDRGC